MKLQYISGVALAMIVAMTGFSTAPAVADNKKWHNPPGQSKKFNGHHKKQGKRGRKMRRHGGPPPWAPARGYRDKRRVAYKHRGTVRYATGAELVRIPDVGFGKCNRDVIGAVLGGAVGAVAGSQIGKGDGRKLATVGGAIVGAIVGGNIGRAMDQVDQNCVGQVLERAPTGKTVIWKNPDRPGDYQVTPTRTYQTSTGQYCREYQTKIVIAGKVENAYGTACRQADGSWKKT